MPLLCIAGFIERTIMIKISVVMPTYNTSTAILREAVDSILAQTYRDFEFIIIDDGSTNDSVDYLLGLRDERIKLIRNPTNLGITKSLNIGLRTARGKYIARMDSDDIALPTRFAKQVAFMENHPNAIACGTNIEYFGVEHGISKARIRDMENYRIRAVFQYPGPTHPTLFLNNEALRKHHITYDEHLVYAQDYGLYAELCKYGDVCILRDVLLRYRVHARQITKQLRGIQIQYDKMTKRKLLAELVGEVTDEELDLHFMYSSGVFKDLIVTPEMLNWYRRLIDANAQIGKYDQKKFKNQVGRIIGRTIRFEPNTQYIQKTVKLFRYVPVPVALEQLVKMTVNRILYSQQQ